MNTHPWAARRLVDEQVATWAGEAGVTEVCTLQTQTTQYLNA